MIRQLKNIYVLDTNQTTYCFRVLKSGQLEHLYYGAHITISSPNDTQTLIEKHCSLPGMGTVYSPEYPGLCLDDLRLEMSSLGKGDMRDSFVEIVHQDGSLSADFVFEHAELAQGVPTAAGLPSTHDSSNTSQTLTVYLRDNNDPALVLELIYRVFEDTDVISRSAAISNTASQETDPEHIVTIMRLMSTMLDLEPQCFGPSGMIYTTFTGAWAREMHRSDIPIAAGTYVNESTTGSSSNKANPFVMISSVHTTEDTGLCLGTNLVYSGNHLESVQVSSFGKVRLLSGINPKNFSWRLHPGERFETPEAIMACSSHGFNGLSRTLCHFTKEHILNPAWRQRPRPIVLNSWEAFYHNITEDNLLELAKVAAELGFELFVIDDGWFGCRDDDTCSLGDWTVNADKFPHGMHWFCTQLSKLGLTCGIWIEPECINKNSHLYRNHPDWILSIPGQDHSECRNQCLLDLSRRDVQDYLIGFVSELLRSAPFTYVKWDMNRMFSDVFSRGLSSDAQQELPHRYMLGLYRCMDELTTRFPEILFEGCSAGGNRFDLGILSYFPQIWASDCTDACERARMQTSYSYAYPQCCVSCHVSAGHNHQTLREIPLESRFAIASFGAFGYEWNLLRLPKTVLDEIKGQIALYKQFRELFQFGDIYRGQSFADHAMTGVPADSCEWTCVAADKRAAIGMRMHKLAVPNTAASIYVPKGLDSNATYRVVRINDQGKETSCSFEAPGNLLMLGGIRCKQSYLPRHGAAGEYEYERDFSSELYLFEAL